MGSKSTCSDQIDKSDACELVGSLARVALDNFILFDALSIALFMETLLWSFFIIFRSGFARSSGAKSTCLAVLLFLALSIAHLWNYFICSRSGFVKL